MQLQIILVLLISGIGAASTYAQSANGWSTHYGGAAFHTAQPCQPGSPYYTARQLGREAYADRHNGDLLEVLVENRPELIDLYGTCVEELSILDSLSALFNPSIYVNLISLEALKELIYERVVDTLCEEIQHQAEEVYGVIADVIPLGEYVYDLDDVFNLRSGV